MDRGVRSARLAEDWDNVGLLWGDPLGPVTRIMTCLTVTPETAGEAIEKGAELIVSHHPVLFRAVKQVRADDRETGVLWRLARAGVSIISPHTAFDNTAGGINDGLARRLGLTGVRPLAGAAARRGRVQGGRVRAPGRPRAGPGGRICRRCRADRGV